MVTRLTDNIYSLDMGLADSINQARNKTIRCIESHLWLTEAGLAEDVVLAPNESYKPKGSGLVAIQALGGTAKYSISTSPSRVDRLIQALRTFTNNAPTEPPSKPIGNFPNDRPLVRLSAQGMERPTQYHRSVRRLGKQREERRVPGN